MKLYVLNREPVDFEMQDVKNIYALGSNYLEVHFTNGEIRTGAWIG